MIIKNVTSNKTNLVLIETKLDGLSIKAELISTKGLTKELIIDIVFLKVSNILVKMDHKIILYFNRSLNILKLPEQL